MLSNPLETLSYYKHRQQQCQPAPRASTQQPTPFPQPHTISQHLLPITETLTQFSWPKRSCTHLRSPALPLTLLTLQELKASTSMHYIALYVLVSRAQSAVLPTPCLYPSTLHLENTIKGVLFSTLMSYWKHYVPEHTLQGSCNTHFV